MAPIDVSEHAFVAGFLDGITEDDARIAAAILLAEAPRDARWAMSIRLDDGRRYAVAVTGFGDPPMIGVIAAGELVQSTR